MVQKTIFCLALSLGLALYSSPVLAQSAGSEAGPAAPFVLDSGTSVLSSSQLSSTSALHVQSGATAIIDFSNESSLSFTGDISNSGNIFAISNNPAVTSASFSAQNIFNNQGAFFSTILPASLSNYAGSVQNLSLSLNAANQIVNAGTISSAANLSISAASIVNTGVINASQNLNISSQLGNIVNSGVISASAGNLNISSMASQNLIINNLNGLLQSVLGNINISTAATADTLEKLNIGLSGGDLIAKELNFRALNGTVDISTEKLEGLLNITGCAAHVQANTSNLNLGQINLSGDPTFYNTGGSINISSNINLSPVTFVSAPVALAIVASGDVTASAAVTEITNNASTSATWTGAVYNGDILIIAGANFTAAPTDGSKSDTSLFPAGGDTTNTLTITGASTTGGSVNLSGVSINSQAGLGGAAPGSANSGNVGIFAYAGSSSKGNISVGQITTGQTNLITNDVSGTNGSVTIVGAGNITIGGIDTSGNFLNTNLNSGNVMVASASIDMLQMPVPSNNFNPTSVQSTLQTGSIYGGVTNTAALPGSNTLYLSNLGGIAVGNLLVLDPQGPNYEQVTVLSTNAANKSITTSTSIQNNHTAGEFVYLKQAGTQNVINAGGGVPGTSPMISNNNIFAPNLADLQSGTITVSGAIKGTGAITLATGSAGQVMINNSLSLTANPTTATPNPLNYQRLPVISIMGGTVTVSSGATVSPAISACNYCPGSVNISTASLVNNGSIGSASGSNTLVSVFSSGNLGISGSGTFTVPAGSAIEFIAADNSSLNLNSALSFATGTASAVIFDAQRSTGAININGNLSFTGGPVVSINSPNITAAANTTLSSSGGGAFLFGSGFTADPLNVNLSTAFTVSGAPAAFTAHSGQNLAFSGTANFNASGAPVLFQTSGGGTINVTGLTLSGDVYQSTNPNGMIQGFEFQPYIGGRISATNSNFAQFASYTYQETLALMANAMAVKDSTTGIVAPPFQYVSTYTQVYSTAYTTPAARQLGLLVSAGVFADINGDGSMTQSAFDTAVYDTQAALQAAAKYGNVMDLVVGNENIVAGAGGNASFSMSTLQTLIQGGNVTIQFVGPSAVTGAQPTRNSTLSPLTGANYTATTLPVVTRQKDGVLNLVTDPLLANSTGMKNLVGALDGYIYSNIYPFFDESAGGVVDTLMTNPAITQADFTTLVTTYLTNNTNTNAANFKSAGLTTQIRIGETGWATPMTSAASDPLKGYSGASLPQQNTTWASWYYPAVQNWSATYANPQSGTNGIIIADYFASYDEPWKGVIGKAPNGTPVTVGAGATQGLTSLPTSNGAIFYTPTLTPMSVVINPNGTNMEVQNYFNPNPGTNDLPISSTNFPSSLVSTHTAGESIVAGSPQEPFFGLFTTTGSNLSTGSIYTLSGLSQKYSVVPTNLTKLSSAPPPPPAPPLLSSASSAGVAPTTSLQNPFSSFLGAAFSSQIQNAQSSIGSINNTTVVQTDINPERIAGSQADQGDLSSVSALADSPTAAGAFRNFNNNILPNPQGSNVNLPNGNAFFLPDHDIVVTTPFAKVNIKEGAAVMIFQTAAGMSVFNLHDSKAGDVAINVGDETQEIGIGRQLTLSSDHPQKAIKEILPASIALRDARNGNIDSKKTVSSEFSHVSAFSSFAGLKKLMHSEDRSERQKASKIMKSAAALILMNKKTESYKSN